MTTLKRTTLIGYLCGIGASICWGFHSVVIRILINEGVDPYLIGVLRLFIGSFVLSIALGMASIVQRKSFPSLRYSKFFWMITISLAMNFLLFHKGLEYTIASDAILIQAFSPVMVLLIVMLFMPDRVAHLLKQPGLTQKIVIILVAGSIGSSLLLSNQVDEPLVTPERKFIGDMIEFVAMFSWALVMLAMHEYQKREPNHSSLAATAQFLFFAGVLLSPFVPWADIFTLTSNQWFWITILGVFSTGVTYILWHLASKYLDIFPLMALFNLESIFNVTLEALVLGLTITWKLILGGFLILYAAVKAELINSKYKIVKPDELEP